MQLKRNKEMEFETLKKSHKKQIIIGALAVCVIGGALTFTTSRAKYKLTEDIELAKGTINYKPYDFKIMAMYKSEDGTNYNEINEMPESGYVVNEDKTYCTTDNKTQVKGKVKTENGRHYITGLTKSDKCYLYFDKHDAAKEMLTILNITPKTETPDFSQIATTDEGTYKVEDGMYGGTSYYWRGAVTNNYVKFANFCWRIIRINGDGSLRLIYDGSTCHVNGTNTNESLIMTSTTYNLNYNQSNYSGWTYNGTEQRTLSGTSSNAKSQLENWYSNNITGTNAAKVSNGKYCNDRDVGPSYVWSINGSTFYSAAYNRIITNNSPTLSCLNGDTYTLNIGLLTADEAMYAGGMGTFNASYYLNNGKSYWLMTSAGWAEGAMVFKMSGSGHIDYGRVSNASGLRPVINLKFDVTFSNGNGTQDNPYVVQ